MVVVVPDEFPLKRLAQTLAEMRDHPQLGALDLELLDDRLTNHLLKIVGNHLCMASIAVGVPKRRRRQRVHREEDKSKARKLLGVAVKKGTIVKPFECDHCGKHVPRDLLHGHHEDYSKPYSVKWLCVPCHSQVHSENEVQVRRPIRVVRT